MVQAIPYENLESTGTEMSLCKYDIRSCATLEDQRQVIRNLQENQTYSPWMNETLAKLFYVITRAKNEGMSRNDVEIMLAGFFASEWQQLLAQHQMYVGLGKAPIANLRRIFCDPKIGATEERDLEIQFLAFRTERRAKEEEPHD